MSSLKERPRCRKRITAILKDGKFTLSDIATSSEFDESHRKQAKKMLHEQMVI
jgi:hypothetical protein